ncbi:MAG: hypothetical protein ACYSTT_20480, partial [Planctomycetota bacterium]
CIRRHDRCERSPVCFTARRQCCQLNSKVATIRACANQSAQALKFLKPAFIFGSDIHSPG